MPWREVHREKQKEDPHGEDTTYGISKKLEELQGIKEASHVEEGEGYVVPLAIVALYAESSCHRHT